MPEKKFEYCEHTTSARLDKEVTKENLNNLGKEGWEAYSSFVYDGFLTTCFRREVNEQSEEDKERDAKAECANLGLRIATDCFCNKKINNHTPTDDLENIALREMIHHADLPPHKRERVLFWVGYYVAESIVDDKWCRKSQK